ncbi:hypothetical protein [Synechococcus sp. UW179A]|uniref:hypothetical protein n=1 Tax=Synechococcus sp. UW179A TaxID=2575510 RepID=UPI000E0EEBC9|nr:hypothetical protein [Synechococcus sp. UW179A]
MNKCTKRFAIFACSVVIAAGAGEVISPILGGLAYEAKMDRCVEAAKENGVIAGPNLLRNCEKGVYIGQFDY